jgi:GNAT superfamily N-acetyltransferase
MPVISANPDAESVTEDQTLLTLYSLAGEESGGFITFRPHFIHEIGKAFFSPGAAASAAGITGEVVVRELTEPEMVRAERELWIYYHQQKADREHDRLFAAFAGTRLIGVARCARHTDGLEVDSVYVLDEFRLKGFARSVMRLLIEECGRNETLYMHSKIELMDFYGSLGFYPIQETGLPKTIRDRFAFCLGELKGIDVCPMKRDPGYEPPQVTA